MTPQQDNLAIVGVTMEELPEDLQKLVEDGIKLFTQKCLLSFGKTREKVIQKTPLPRVLMHSEMDQTTEEERRFMSEAFHKMINEALTKHNTVFLQTFSNIMKASLAGFPSGQRGPVYFNLPQTNASPNPNGEGSGAEQTQQPMGESGFNFGTTEDVPPSARKIASSVRRITRDVDYHINRALQAKDGQLPGNDDCPPGFVPVLDNRQWGISPCPDIRSSTDSTEKLAAKIADMVETKLGGF